MGTVVENHREPRAERQRDDATAVGGNERSGDDVKCIRLGVERLKGRSNIPGASDFEWRDFDAERASRGLNLTHLQLGLGKANIKNDCQPAETWDDLTQEFEPLAGKIGLLDR
jgi:hypothetical protein